MQPKLQQIEIQSVRRDDHDLAVDDRPDRELLEQRVMKLGKVPVERPEVPALNVDVGFAAEDDGAEAVPFWLVQEPTAGWQRLGKLREHGFYRRGDGEHTSRKSRV